MAGEVLQVALRLGIGMAGVVNYVGVSYAKFRSGEAGTVCCVMVVRGEFRSGQVRQAWLVESW